MPLGSAPMSTIDIDFTRAQGVNSSGWIFFQPTRQTVGTTIISKYIVEVEVKDGVGSVDLVRLPAGAYHVREMIDGRSEHEFSFALPVSSDPLIQYEHIAQVSPVPVYFTNVKSVNGILPNPVTGDVEVSGGGGSVPDATPSVKGKLQLAGDLGGTAAAPTVPGLVTKYVKPGGGIPLTDFSAAVQALLDKANTATQPADLTAYVTGSALTPLLAGKENVGAASVAIDEHLAALDPHPQYAKESDLASVATSGAYSSLTGRPTIPDSPDDIGAQPAGDYATNATTTGLTTRLIVVENFSFVCPFLAQEYGMYSATGPDPLQFLTASTWNNNDHGFSAQWVPAGKSIVKVAVAIRTNGTYSATGTPAQATVCDLTSTKIAESPHDPTMFLTKGWSLQTLTTPIAPQSSGRWVLIGVSGGGFTGHSLAWPSAVSDWPEGTSIGLSTGLRRAFYGGSSAGLPSTFNPATYGTATSYAPLIGLIG